MTTRRNLPPFAAARAPLRKAALAFAIAGGFVGGAHAATFTVTNTSDSDEGSLRWALQQANETPGADDIVFAAGVSGAILLQDDLQIFDDVRITGPGRDALAIDAQGTSRVFDMWRPAALPPLEGVVVAPVAVSIEGLTVRGGYGEGKGIDDSSGGCIRAVSTALELVESRVTGCESRGSGGGIAFTRYDSRYGVAEAAHSLVVTASEISDNVALASGGGVSMFVRNGVDGLGGAVLLQDSVVSGNVVETPPPPEGYYTGGPGGGIEIFGDGRFDVTLTDSVISGNSASELGGGGLVVYQPDANGSVRIDGTTFANNDVTSFPGGGGPFAGGGGGALLLTSAQVSVDGALFTANAGLPPIEPLRKGFLSGGLGGGLSVQAIGGLPTVDVRDSRFEGNSAVFGGGLAVMPGQSGPPPVSAGKAGAVHWSRRTRGAGTPRAIEGSALPGVRIERTTIASNQALVAPGAAIISALRPDTAPVRGATTAPVLVSDTTVSGNVTVEGLGQQTPALAMVGTGGVRLLQTTVSGNAGGGVLAASYDDPATAGEIGIIDNATIVDNAGPGVQLGIDAPQLLALLPGAEAYPPQDRSYAVRNSIVHGNRIEGKGEPQAADIVGDTANLRLVHVLTAMPESAFPGFVGEGNLFDVADAMLGALADNGGATRTHLPLAGSPAIDAGDPAFAPPPATDQRGEPRVQGTAVDIGAVETLGLEPGTVQFDPASLSVDEDAGTVTLTLTRTGGDDGAVSVDWATSDATATAGADYTAGAGTVQWADGDAAAKTFTVAILDDTLVEADETFTVALDGAEGGIDIGTADTATVTIVSDDVAQRGVPLFDQTEVSVDEDAGFASVTLRRTGGSDGVLVVDYTTVAQTAQPGSDYTTVAARLTWQDGDTTPAMISVPIIDDAIEEGDETFLVSTSYPAGSPDDPSLLNSARLTIVDNDEPLPPDTLGFAGADEDGVLRLRVDESGTPAATAAKGTLVLTVERTGSGAGAASVDFATVDGTATAPSDYASTSGTLSWADGDTGARTIALDIVEDTSPPEPDETFSVLLSNASGAGLDGLQAEIVIVANGVVEPPPQGAAPNVIPVNDWRGKLALFGAMLLGAFVALRRRIG